jgi:hypothetical protein
MAKGKRRDRLVYLQLMAHSGLDAWGDACGHPGPSESHLCIGGISL